MWHNLQEEERKTGKDDKTFKRRRAVQKFTLPVPSDFGSV